MSATNRGAERVESDFYPTPSKSVFSMMQALPQLELAGSRWLEPCVGGASIVCAVNHYAEKRWKLNAPKWTTMDINPLGAMVPFRLEQKINFTQHDFLTYDFGDQRFDVVATNPPFTYALEFLDKSFTLAPIVIMLLRVGFLGAIKRSEWWQDHEPDRFMVLSDRPYPDATEYAWFAWGLTPDKVRVLPPFYWEAPPDQLRIELK